MRLYKKLEKPETILKASEAVRETQIICKGIRNIRFWNCNPRKQKSDF